MSSVGADVCGVLPAALALVAGGVCSSNAQTLDCGGSAALALGADLMREHGVDSLIGRTAAVMLGSSETTFYTISVYFGAAGIKRTRYAIPAALCADAVGFFCAALFTRLFFS